MIVKSNLKQVLEAKNMEQKDLSKMTGIREATISEMCRDINKMFSRNVLNKIVNALDITDINELIILVEEQKE
ncbi:helix-turn-helix domain-containing protein [Bacillus sp. SCS-151]|uniref:helix-turn-helix domain-containing protein n=1 Tax=Nanhaiella sioensis TaxID=3115293 RepID=UPI00397DCBE9